MGDWEGMTGRGQWVGEMGRGATGWGRWGGGQRGGLDGQRGNGEGEMERGATGRGRWGGRWRWGKWEGGDGEGATKGKTGKLAKGKGRRRGKRRGDFTYEMLGWTYGMPGWNEVTDFFDFVYPCNSGYPS